MDNQILKYAHLRMGITRSELQRRLISGQIDMQIIKSQLDENSREMKLDVRSEIFLEQKSLDQVDKFKATK